MFAASVQDVETSAALADQLGVDVPILADTDAAVAKAFGIYELPGSMGPFSTHSFWLIDDSGVIRFGEVSLQMNVPFERVAAAVAGL